MKKTIKTVAATLLGVAVIVGSTAFAQSRISENKSIGSENAIKFALKDAGYTEEQVRMLRSEFERENGQYVFEVDFIKDGVEYEYDILASDGTIVKKDVDRKNSIVKEDKQNLNTGSNQTEKKNEKSETKATENSITMEKAREIALADAGVKAADATFTKEKTDTEDGVPTFELEFYSNNTEYEYEISQSNGTIMSKEIDRNERRQVSVSSQNIPVTKESAPTQSTQTQNTPAPKESAPTQNTPAVKESAPAQPTQTQSSPEQKESTQTETSNQISVESAKQIALSSAGVTSANFSKAKLDTEDGRLVYEVEFYVGNTEYEYEIDAYTGAIVDWDIDVEDND